MDLSIRWFSEARGHKLEDLCKRLGVTLDGAHRAVNEAAVVGVPHDVKGQAIYCYVSLMSGHEPSDELKKELSDWVRNEIGPIAKPDFIQFAPGLPKTRSGKIMRRLLRTVARGDEVTQDVSTLENPQILDQLQAKGT